MVQNVRRDRFSSKSIKLMIQIDTILAFEVRCEIQQALKEIQEEIDPPRNFEGVKFCKCCAQI